MLYRRGCHVSYRLRFERPEAADGTAGGGDVAARRGSVDRIDAGQQTVRRIGPQVSFRFVYRCIGTVFCYICGRMPIAARKLVRLLSLRSCSHHISFGLLEDSRRPVTHSGQAALDTLIVVRR